MRAKISRRGFRSRKYPVPADVLAQAETAVQRYADQCEHMIATLRPAVYCGPGSGGDRGAYTLEVWGHVNSHGPDPDRSFTQVLSIERQCQHCGEAMGGQPMAELGHPDGGCKVVHQEQCGTYLLAHGWDIA